MARPLVICGPSGVGKGTLFKKLMEEFPAAFALSVSHTTRKPRPALNEKDGVEYHFVSRDEMKTGIAAGEFIENAEFRSGIHSSCQAGFPLCQKLLYLGTKFLLSGTLLMRNEDFYY